MGEDSSLLGSKKSHSIKHSPQRATSGLVNQAELQGSFFWTGFASKEYTSGEGESPAEERASGAKADTSRVQDQDWCSTGRSKNQRGNTAKEQWRFQVGDEATIWENYEHDEAVDGNDETKTSPNLDCTH